MNSDLFQPLKAGDITLPNRILMAPLTRGRATPDAVPTPIMATYYEQRAEAGLLISEATAVSPMGYGWVNAPAMYNDAQEQGWKQVTSAVHKAGGRIFLQLWHMGRVSHPDFLNGGQPVAPSALTAKGRAITPEGRKPYVEPRALTVEEIKATVQDYAKATERALRAGFDGVEVHAANGYLIDQFLRDGSNQRTDEYGGSIENRARFLKEVVEAVAKVAGAGKVGVRISPCNDFNDMQDSNPLELSAYVAKMLDGYGLSYLHSREMGDDGRLADVLRKNFSGVLVLNDGYTREKGEAVLKSGKADAFAFGVPFLANPDLVQRLRVNAPLNAPDVSTFYTHDARGYTDYPTLSSRAA